MRLISKCEMWSRNATSDFSFAEILCEFVLVIMFNHLIVYVRLSDSSFFEMTNALTKAIHQTWRKRFIKLDTSDISSFLISNISSNLMKCISSNLIKFDIKSDNCVSSNLDKRYFIKFDDISSNSTKILFVLSDERFWMTSEDVK